MTGTMYNDLFIRDSFRDTGIFPSTGDACQSPDIIPQQNGTLAWATANSTYGGPDQGKSIINGGVNNIYVRVKNLNTAAGAGTASLYYANASLFLLPTTWTPVSAAGGAASVPLVDGTGNTNIAASGVAISSPSFLLTGLPAGPHYCTIAVIQTPTHPVTVPTSFPSNAAFVQWVQNNPGVGWRNISYAPNQQTQTVRTFSFASVNPVAAYFHFRILGRGFVTGTAVNAQCSDQTCPISQNMTLPAADGQGNQITGFDASVPANFSGTLVVTLTSPGGPFPPAATVTMTYYQYPSLADDAEMAVARPAQTVRHSDVGAIESAPMLIQIGECTITMVSGLPGEVEG